MWHIFCPSRVDGNTIRTHNVLVMSIQPNAACARIRDRKKITCVGNFTSGKDATLDAVCVKFGRFCHVEYIANLSNYQFCQFWIEYVAKFPFCGASSLNGMQDAYTENEPNLAAYKLGFVYFAGVGRHAFRRTKFNFYSAPVPLLLECLFVLTVISSLPINGSLIHVHGARANHVSCWSDTQIN